MKRDDKLGPELADISLFPNPADAKETSLLGMATGLAAVLARAASPMLRYVPLPGQASTEEPPHFSIRHLREGGKHAVIVVNGFLSKGDCDTNDWEKAIRRKFGRATWYHLDWEAYRHPAKQLGDLFTADGLWKRATGKGEPDMWAAWHTTMKSAERAGDLLAEAILRTPGWRFTLAGHSLGARVIHFALKALEKRSSSKRVTNVYLLGGAVGGSDKDNGCWEKAVNAVSGKIFNCYSFNDKILERAYQGANLMLSRPAGYTGIRLQHERIVDRDFSQLVSGHMVWKDNFAEILTRLAEH
jgi:pimeloyl-ACP methyl ester carboxylesterase